MSEFQTRGDHAQDPGRRRTTDSLINRVRKQPFSVVLLDEFEKAHAAIWDLFLQVFDDGRLTDAMGHVADFRHCIIILTTNLGATSHRTSGLGFAPTADAFTDEPDHARDRPDLPARVPEPARQGDRVPSARRAI